PVVLNALDADVRSRSTDLTQLIGRAMLQESEADLAVFNGGMIRLDDLISPGAISQYDVIRLLPFGNRMVTVTMTGELLQKVLTQGSANQGTGGYLHWAGLNPQTLQPKGIYRVVIPDFLLTGKEVGLSFLTRQSSGLVVLKEQRDLRHVLVDYLKKVGQQAFESQ
ncbi:MAG: 5'-nucleotidase C-terminal domain-containing protein, partial [Microcystaceae cyanobacterium]